jgi:hypothetical protein
VIKKKPIKTPNLIVLIVIIIIAWIIFFVATKYFFGTWTQESGWFGDSFGGLNSLFSGLAFAGIIYTIFLQKQELRLQRKELRQTRQEFIVQNETLKKQRFENTFFHLLDLHNEIVDKLDITRNEGGPHTINWVRYSKRDFFTGAINVLSDQSQMDDEFEDAKDSWTVIQDAYRTFNFEFSTHLSHYFRNLYHIYKYTHFSKLISLEEKEFYTSIIRAQLSDSELTLIFYNMLVEGLGHPNFKFLDQKYNILKNMDDSMLDSHLKAFEFAEVTIDPFKTINK